MQHKILWKRWKFLTNLLLPTLGPMNSDGETCCKNASSNSNNYLTDDQKLSKRCSNAGLKTVERGQYFITLDTEGPSGMVHWCREFSLPRNDPRPRARGWIRKNRKIGPVLNVHFLSSWRSLQYWISGLISVSRKNRLLGSNCEWNWMVRERNDRNHGRRRAWSFREPIATARSNEININADTHLRSSTRKKVGGRQSGKLWSWVLRRIKSNDQIATSWSTYSSIVEEFNKRRRNNFDGASQWSLNDWISILAKGGGAKKRFQYCLTPNSSRHILYFRAIQWHSGSIAYPSCKTMYLLPKRIYRVHLPRRECGRSLKRGRQSVFFTIVNPMEDENCVEETSCDLTKPRICSIQKDLETSS